MVTELITILIPFLLDDDSDGDDDVQLRVEDEENEELALERQFAGDDETILGIFTESIIQSSMHTTRIKSTDYWHTVFPRLCDDCDSNNFKKEYRISRNSFNVLLARLSQHPVYTPSETLFRPQTPLPIQVACCLLRLGYNQWIKRMERDFGFAQGTISNFTERFLEAMEDCFKDIIKWPTGDRVDDVVDGFANALIRGEKHIPNVIGAVDGTLIKIISPSKYGPRYIDRHGDHSLNVLVVCDYQERFTYLYVGEPGGSHDSRVLRRSPLWQMINSHKEQIFPRDTHLLGDSGYPLLEVLLTPFPKQQATNDRRKRIFNAVHSSTRLTIERTIGKLKGRFPIFGQTMRMRSLKRIARTTHVGGIIHNLAMMEGDDWNIPEHMEIEDDVEIGGNPINLQEEQSRANGRLKRSIIADRLQFIQ